MLKGVFGKSGADSQAGQRHAAEEPRAAAPAEPLPPSANAQQGAARGCRLLEEAALQVLHLTCFPWRSLDGAAAGS